MLNLELARIVVAERRRTIDERVRQAQLREAVAERESASRAAAAGAQPHPCVEPATGGRVLGPSR